MISAITTTPGPAPRPASPTAADVQHEFDAKDEYTQWAYQEYEQNPACLSSLCQKAGDFKADFREHVLSLNLPDQARQTAIKSLGAGLLCGALDGVILFAANQVPGDLPVRDEVGTFINNQRDTLVAAREELKNTNPDILQGTLSQFKGFAATMVDSVEQSAATLSPGDYQRAQLGLFAMGYAIGAANSLITCETDQSSGTGHPSC